MSGEGSQLTLAPPQKPGPRRFIGRAHSAATELPDALRRDIEAAVAIALPNNYNFEICKTIARIRSAKSKCVALQLPEGLLVYAFCITDILKQFSDVDDIVIMGDVTYGACCVDDYTAEALGCDLLVHYGHSCLVPVDQCRIPTLYVFVTIGIDVAHICDTIVASFPVDSRLAIAGTIQFEPAIAALSQNLQGRHVQVPQVKPLSKGEVLGCTSPVLDENQVDAIVFVSDGRFHLESLMIANPNIEAFRYDPYQKRLTRERYEHEQMRSMRQNAIERASKARYWGVVLGTLGRQGNMAIVKRLENALEAKGLPFVVVLLSEVFPSKLAMFDGIDAWVQVACPRLSIDWGTAFETPMLSAYEAMVALDKTEWKKVYPMDFYAGDGDEWTNYHGRTRVKEPRADKELLRLRAKEARARRARKHIELSLEVPESKPQLLKTTDISS